MSGAPDIDANGKPRPEENLSLGRLLSMTLQLMRSHSGVLWLALVLLGVVGTVTEAVGAGLIFGLVLSAAQGTPVADAMPRVVIEFVPWLGNLENAGFILVVGGFFIFRATLSALLAFYGYRTVFRTATSLSEDLMAGYLAQSYTFHVRRGSAELIRNVRESVDALAHLVLAPLIRAGSEAFVSVGLIVALIAIAPGATLIVLSALAIVGLLTFLLMRLTLVPLGRTSHNASISSLKAAQELLRGIRDIKLLKTDRTIREPFVRAQRDWGRANYWRSTVHAAPRVIAETTLAIVVLAVLLRTPTSGSSGSEALAMVGLFAYAAVRLIPAAVSVFNALNGLSFGAAAMTAVFKDIEAIPAAATPFGHDEQSPTHLVVAEIVFNDVWYTHPGSRDPVIEAVDLRIRRGESVGVIGASGSGKSTLVDLLIGLLDPDSGSVEVDGVSIQQLPGWRQSLGVVSQTPFIADDTILANIAFGEEPDKVDRQQAYRLAEIAQIPRFLQAGRPDLDARVGEQGIELSGGERQRVAIARALYRSPDVLILDEATSALDVATEEDVLAGVLAEMAGRFVVIVAHRPSAIRFCSQLVVMSNGRAVVAGSYESVVQSDGFQSVMRDQGLAEAKAPEA